MKKLFKAAWLRVVAWYVKKRYNARPSGEHEPADTSPCLIAPPVTHEMAMAGLIWAKTVDGGWREVCDFCGGNCGQCGMTGRLGNPGFSFDRIVENSGMKEGCVGLPMPQ